MVIRLNKLPEMSKSTFLDSRVKWELLRYIKAQLSPLLYETWDNYIKENLNLDISLNKLIRQIIKNLKFFENNDTFIWYVPDYIYLLSTEYKLNDLITLIDKGNVDIKGTNIFSNATIYIENNIYKKLIRQIW